jgi:hypothetical protein
MWTTSEVSGYRDCEVTAQSGAAGVYTGGAVPPPEILRA